MLFVELAKFDDVKIHYALKWFNTFHEDGAASLYLIPRLVLKVGQLQTHRNRVRHGDRVSVILARKPMKLPTKLQFPLFFSSLVIPILYETVIMTAIHVSPICLLFGLVQYKASA